MRGLTHGRPLSGPAGSAGFSLCIALLATSALLAPKAADAQIGVSPPRTEFMLDGPAKTHTIRVFNLGNQTVDIVVEVNNWELDENNDVVIIPPTEQSLDQWLVINPLRFTLEPGGSQAVRFAARPRVEPEPGEHRALIYFQQLPPEEAEGAHDTPKVLFRLGTSVTGLVEPVIRKAVVHAVTADADAIEIEIESLGNTHVRLDGQWAMWRADAFPGPESTGIIDGLGEREDVVLPDGVVAAWRLNALPVLPKTRRTVTTSITSELKPGSYILDLKGAVGDADLSRTFDIEVIGPDATAEASDADRATGPTIDLESPPGSDTPDRR